VDVGVHELAAPEAVGLAGHRQSSPDAIRRASARRAFILRVESLDCWFAPRLVPAFVPALRPDRDPTPRQNDLVAPLPMPHS